MPNPYFSPPDPLCYRPDGSMRPEYVRWLQAQGVTDEEIQRRQQREMEQVADWEKAEAHNPPLKNNPILIRQGLDPEELLSQGLASYDDFYDFEDELEEDEAETEKEWEWSSERDF